MKRLAGLSSLPFIVAVLLVCALVPGCDNPFDPLKSTDKIQGLTYFDFSATQAKWDSDPESDGLAISVKYYNEFEDSLSFQGKPHKIIIEFWSEVSEGDPPVKSRGSLLTTKTVEMSNSDDVIRIPIEYYAGTLEFADPPAAIKGYLLMRLFPPQEYPQKELVFLISDVEFYKPETLPE